MQQILSLETLGALDHGAAEIIIDAALDEVCRDLADRGDDGKERSVVITVSMKRRKNGDAEVACAAIAKVPKRRTSDTTALIRQRGQNAPAALVFQSEAPREPNQRLIQDKIDEVAEDR